MRLNRFFIPPLLLLAALTILAAGEKAGEKELLENLDLFTDVVTMINEDYYQEMKPGELMIGAIEGMLASLDRYSYIKMSPEAGGAGLGIELAIVSDAAEPIEENIGNIESLALVGGLLAIGVLWAFLRHLPLVAVVALSIIGGVERDRIQRGGGDDEAGEVAAEQPPSLYCHVVVLLFQAMLEEKKVHQQTPLKKHQIVQSEFLLFHKMTYRGEQVIAYLLESL